MKQGKLFGQRKNMKAMTLVEVLLSISILGILSVLITGVFANSIGLISRAGDLDKTGYTAAKVTENAIAGLDVTQEGSEVTAENVVPNTDITPETTEVTIDFPMKTIEILGEKDEITANGNINEVKIEVFIPDEFPDE